MPKSSHRMSLSDDEDDGARPASTPARSEGAPADAPISGDDAEHELSLALRRASISGQPAFLAISPTIRPSADSTNIVAQIPMDIDAALAASPQEHADMQLRTMAQINAQARIVQLTALIGTLTDATEIQTATRELNLATTLVTNPRSAWDVMRLHKSKHGDLLFKQLRTIIGDSQKTFIGGGGSIQRCLRDAGRLKREMETLVAEIAPGLEAVSGPNPKDFAIAHQLTTLMFDAAQLHQFVNTLWSAANFGSSGLCKRMSKLWDLMDRISAVRAHLLAAVEDRNRLLQQMLDEMARFGEGSIRGPRASADRRQ